MRLRTRTFLLVCAALAAGGTLHHAPQRVADGYRQALQAWEGGHIWTVLFTVVASLLWLCVYAYDAVAQLADVADKAVGMLPEQMRRQVIAFANSKPGRAWLAFCGLNIAIVATAWTYPQDFGWLSFIPRAEFILGILAINGLDRGNREGYDIIRSMEFRARYL